MATDNKVEMTAVDVAEGDQTPEDGLSDLDVTQQTRVQRLFTESQLFAFSMSYLDTWLAVAGSMYYAMLNGGPVAYVFNYIIVFLGVLAQSASFAELASIYPVAGGQYYWTHKLSPPKWKRFLTWCQGWTTWVAFVAALAAIANTDTLAIEAIIKLNDPSYVVVGWRTFLIVAGEIVLCAVVNLWFFWILPWFELFTGLLYICFFFILFVTVWVMAPRNPPSFLLEKAVFSGWDNYFISWNIGVLSQAWLFCGFEAIVHMSEDTRNPKVVIPRGLFTSVAFNGFTGLIMLFTWAICMPPDIESVINSTSPLVTLLEYATGSKTITTVIAIGRIIISFSSCMATFASTTRLTWAWARDGGLPQYFGYVGEKNRVPSRAIVLTTVLVLLLAMLNLGSASYVALGAITSLSVIGFYVSYIIMFSVTLYTRYGTKEGLVLGQWNLGRFGPFINVFALLFTCWFIIFLGFPSILPVTASNMNWSLPAYVSIMILAGTLWVFRASKTWPGPNERVVAIVLKDS